VKRSFDECSEEFAYFLHRRNAFDSSEYGADCLHNCSSNDDARLGSRDHSIVCMHAGLLGLFQKQIAQSHSNNRPAGFWQLEHLRV
jgi:hypothetical protein